MANVQNMTAAYCRSPDLRFLARARFISWVCCLFAIALVYVPRLEAKSPVCPYKVRVTPLWSSGAKYDESDRDKRFVLQYEIKLPKEPEQECKVYFSLRWETPQGMWETFWEWDVNLEEAETNRMLVLHKCPIQTCPRKQKGNFIKVTLSFKKITRDKYIPLEDYPFKVKWKEDGL